MEIKTERLTIHLASDQEMISLINNTIDEELKKAYQEMYDGCINYPKQKEFYAPWIIELDNVFIGDMCFKGLKYKKTEVGYGLLDEYQNKGYGSESVNALVNWALAQDRVNKVFALVEDGNNASCKLLEKIGFKKTNKIIDNCMCYEKRK